MPISSDTDFVGCSNRSDFVRGKVRRLSNDELSEQEECSLDIQPTGPTTGFFNNTNAVVSGNYNYAMGHDTHASFSGIYIGGARDLVNSLQNQDENQWRERQMQARRQSYQEFLRDVNRDMNIASVYSDSPSYTVKPVLAPTYIPTEKPTSKLYKTLREDGSKVVTKSMEVWTAFKAEWKRDITDPILNWMKK
jgi:hypothetical protein